MKTYEIELSGDDTNAFRRIEGEKSLIGSFPPSMTRSVDLARLIISDHLSRPATNLEVGRAGICLFKKLVFDDEPLTITLDMLDRAIAGRESHERPDY